MPVCSSLSPALRRKRSCDAWRSITLTNHSAGVSPPCPNPCRLLICLQMPILYYKRIHWEGNLSNWWKKPFRLLKKLVKKQISSLVLSFWVWIYYLKHALLSISCKNTNSWETLRKIWRFKVNSMYRKRKWMSKNSMSYCNKKRIIPDCLTEESYNSQQSENRILSKSIANVVQPCLSAEHVLNNQVKRCSGVVIDKNNLLNIDAINNQFSLKTNGDYNFAVTSHTTKIKQYLSPVSTHHNSLNSSD